MPQNLHFDNALVQRFAATGNEEDFEVLVQRHGCLVFNTCNRILRNQHEAEDATQAVFLTLASKAGSLKRQRSIAAWLHKVSIHVSLRALKSRQARKKRESKVAKAKKHFVVENEDSVLSVLDQELQSIPEKLRTPFILHYLGGYTCQQIGLTLSSNKETIKSRLKKARELLRTRLTKKGLERK